MQNSEFETAISYPYSNLNECLAKKASGGDEAVLEMANTFYVTDIATVHRTYKLQKEIAIKPTFTV